jgi:hypothetical protein
MHRMIVEPGSSCIMPSDFCPETGFRLQINAALLKRVYGASRQRARWFGKATLAPHLFASS